MDKRIFCNKCKRMTNHKLVDSKRNDYNCENDIEYMETIINEVYICCGCDTYTIIEKWTCSGYADSNGQIYEEEFIPTRNNNQLEKKIFFLALPNKIDKLYTGIINSYNNKDYILAVAGVRICIESILKLKDKNTKKLQTLIDHATYLSEDFRDALDSCRYLGNESIHEASSLTMEETKYIIELLEKLISTIFESTAKNERIIDLAKEHGKKEKQLV